MEEARYSPLVVYDVTIAAFTQLSSVFKTIGPPWKSIGRSALRATSTLTFTPDNICGKTTLRISYTSYFTIEQPFTIKLLCFSSCHFVI